MIHRRKSRCIECHRNHLHTGCTVNHEHSIPLSVGEIEKDYKIICNPNPKCFELGLCHGNLIRIIKNNDYDRNLVIAVGDSRYIISRNVADKIMIEIFEIGNP